MSTIVCNQKSEEYRSFSLDTSDGDKDLALRAVLKGQPNRIEQIACDNSGVDPSHRFWRIHFERRALSTNTGPLGEFNTQEAFVAGYSLGLRQTFPFSDLVTRVSGEPLTRRVDWPTADDNNTGEILPNDEWPMTEPSSDASFQATRLYPKLFASKKIKVSRTLLNRVPAMVGRVGEM